jgi:hypothetical protein
MTNIGDALISHQEQLIVLQQRVHDLEMNLRELTTIAVCAFALAERPESASTQVPKIMASLKELMRAQVPERYKKPT